jgi:hypothetical protein
LQIFLVPRDRGVSEKLVVKLSEQMTLYRYGAVGLFVERGRLSLPASA